MQSFRNVAHIRNDSLDAIATAFNLGNDCFYERLKQTLEMILGIL
jgi:hypothetical protein